MIVFTPLALPKLEPDNWETFWNIWNSNADYATKTYVHSHSDIKKGDNSLWRGLDIYERKPWAPNTAWKCPYYDMSNDLPNFMSSILSLNINIYRVKLLESLKDINSHSDDEKDKWHIRCFLHYPSPKSQWYITRPRQSERTYIDMPTDTNWFAYNDKYSWHGTDYNPEFPKIIMQLYFYDPITDLVQAGIDKYKEYTVEY